MYATHLACRALATGEINGAVVGGTNLILDAAVQMAVDKMGVLSHSKCILMKWCLFFRQEPGCLVSRSPFPKLHFLIP